MQGLTQFEHYVVGYIDDRINATDIGAAQTLNHPKRRRARQINITDNTPEITRACLGSQDLDWTCVVMMQRRHGRSEEHTSELQSLMRISYAVFGWKKKKNKDTTK